MEFPKDQTAVVIFAALFVPGFVSMQVFALQVPSEPRDFGKQLYEVIGYSSFTYALWSPLLVALYGGWQPPFWLAATLAFAVLLVTPAVLPLVLLAVIRKWFSSRLIDPYPTSWDWAFKSCKRAMLLVHLKDGRRVGGSWEGNAFSSSYPIPPDLFLSDVWNVDQTTGEFIDRAADNMGLLLWGNDIEMIEFFDIDKIRSSADARRQAKPDAR
jgi:hypothetical protein